MAKKGLRYVAFGLWESDGTYTTGQGKHLSPAAGFSASATTSDVKDYGDDRVVETDKSVTGGTLNVELNNDEDEMYTYLLGAKTTTGSGEDAGKIVSNVDDVAPFVGAGCVGKSGSKWVAKIYLKTQFAEPADENSTKEENTTFNHISLEGDILTQENGEWRWRKSFATFEAAKTWVDTVLGVTTTPANPANPG